MKFAPEFQGPARGRQRQGTLDIWQKLSRGIILILVLTGIGFLGSQFGPEILRQRELDRQIAQLEAQEARLRDQLDILKQQYQWLRDDPQYQEMVARDRLGLRKEGETIVRIIREP